MPEAYLCRHGHAEPHHPQGDALRRLSEEGRQRFHAHVLRLRARLRVNRVLSSPYLRARQTAEIAATVLGLAVVEHAALASGHSGGQALLRLLRELGPGVLLVGHNPELAEALSLAAGQPHPVSPGTLAAVRLMDHDLRVSWSEAP